MPKYSIPEQGPSKPLVFGEGALDTERLEGYEVAMQQFDASYVPGYSEAKVENELRVRDGKPPIPIPKLQWVRVKKPNAADWVSETDEGMVEWRRLGFRAMGKDDLRKYGYGWPPAAGSGPDSDGLIRRGDLALFFVDESRASRNRKVRDLELSEEAENAVIKQFDPGEKARGKIESLPEKRSDEEGRFFLGDSNIPDL